jgi:tetratricopeptide (TPR) repeat protein
MASKVNNKAVFLVAGGLVASVVALGVAWKMVQKSASDHKQAGEQYMSEGKYAEAADAFSRAVNKESNRPELLKLWTDALSKLQPESLQSYTDRYKEYAGSIRRYAEVMRDDPAAHKPILELTLRDARTSGTKPQMWMGLEQQASDSVGFFKPGDERVNLIRKYRGIGTTGRFLLGVDISAEDQKRAMEDLEAGVKADPNDPQAVVSLADLLRVKAEKLRQGMNNEEAQQLEDRARALVAEFLSRNPDSAQVMLSQMTDSLAQLGRDVRDRKKTLEEASREGTKLIEAVLAAAERQDVKTMDDLSFMQVAEMAAANNVPNAKERVLAVYDKLIQGRNQDPLMEFARARFIFGQSDFRAAADEFKRISNLPNRPISPEGAQLFVIRDMSAAQRVDALLALWERTAPELREPILNEAKTARDEAKARPALEETTKQLMDAKISIASGDAAEARKLLANYHQATNFGNAEAMMMSVDVFLRQGLTGEARSMLQKVLQMRPGDLMVLRRLAAVEIQLRNYNAALVAIEEALTKAPNDEALKQLREQVDQIVRGRGSDNPLVQKLAEAESLINATPPDFENGARLLREAAVDCNQPGQFASIAQTLARMNRRGDAAFVVKEGLKKHPGDETLVRLDKSLAVEDPVKAALEEITTGQGSVAEKALRRYFVLSQAGRPEEAMKAFEEAAAADPENPVVISVSFDRALEKRDEKAAEELSAKATSKNLDRMQGRLFRARVAMMKNQLPEAQLLLQQAVEIDPVNPLAHRLLGQAYVLNRDVSAGIKSLERAVSIKPDDPTALLLYMNALAGSGQTGEALNAARGALRFGINDPNFLDVWLDLEAEVGERDLAIDRRTRLFAQDPANVQNALKLATIQLRDRRVEDASRTLSALDGKKEAEPQLSLLKAGVIGARGDTPGAEKAFEEAIKSLDKDKLDGTIHIQFAELVRTLGNFELAIKVLEKGRATQRPEDALVDRVLGDTYFALDRHVEAAEAYERARDSVKEDVNNLLLKRVIECYLRAEKFDRVTELTNKLGGERSTDQQILLLLADMADRRKEPAKARELLDKAVELNPQAAVGYLRRAEFLIKDSQTLNEAGLDLEQAVRLEPKNVRGRMLLSDFLIRKGDVTTALSRLEVGVKENPFEPMLRERQVALLVNLNRKNEAIEVARAGFKNTSDPRWAMQAGIILLSEQQTRAAADSFREAWNARRTPQHGKALADTLLAMNPPEITEAQQIIADPGFGLETNAFSQMTAARLAMAQQRFDDAKGHIQRSLTMPPPGGLNLGDLRDGLVAADEINRTMGNRPDTAAGLLESIAPQDGWPDAFKLNIIRLKVLGSEPKTPKREEALTQMQTMLDSKDPNTVIAAASLLGTTLFNENRCDQAVAVYQKGLAANQQHAELLNNLAYVLSKCLSKHSDALPLAERAAEAEPSNPNILDTLGSIQLALNKFEAAESTLTRALAVASDPQSRAMPLVHMVEVNLAQKETSVAQEFMSELEDLARRDARVTRLHGGEIERVKKLMAAAPR